MKWKSATAHKWMKRLDPLDDLRVHYGRATPFALLALPERSGWVLFWIAWGGAIAGVLLKMCWPSAPRWVSVPLYLLFAGVGRRLVHRADHGAGVAALVLLIVGGALYSVGGVLSTLKWPNPGVRSGITSSSRLHRGGRFTCHYIAMWFRGLLVFERGGWFSAASQVAAGDRQVAHPPADVGGVSAVPGPSGQQR